MKGEEPSAESLGLRPLRTVAYRCDCPAILHFRSLFDRGQHPERVRDLSIVGMVTPWSRFGDKLHLRLNIDAKSIANKESCKEL
uniref:Uncharacterized protein n=1 Tax=Heterorhabditis bacteriophora TaxID=37862 RepID=A0A1I7WDM9_HETBA